MKGPRPSCDLQKEALMASPYEAADAAYDDYEDEHL
jgi:hypothetical protein